MKCNENEAIVNQNIYDNATIYIRTTKIRTRKKQQKNKEFFADNFMF